MENWKRTDKSNHPSYSLYEKEIWCKNPKRDMSLVITKEKNSLVWEAEYYFSRTSTGKWGGYSENEVLIKALNAIEQKEKQL